MNSRGHCGSPALAKRNAEAQCETFLAFKANPAHPPSPKCKQCGGDTHVVGGEIRHIDGVQRHFPVV